MTATIPDETPADPTVQAEALVAGSFDSLLDLGLPAESKLTARIRPLARQLLVQLDPQDAPEQMLAVQMIASFSRAMYLSRNANRQTNPKWFALYSNQCDRAMAQFRRQMQIFTDLRRPRRTTFNAIRHANIAGQQIVMNPSSPTSESIAESNPGSSPISNPPAPHGTLRETQATTLPPHPSRPRRPERQCPKEPPLGT